MYRITSSVGILVSLAYPAFTEPTSWIDSIGRNCTTYVSEAMCLAGSYGPKWKHDVDGHFQDYADDDGIDAGDRCCECIPSDSLKFTALGCPNRIEPDRLWQDVSGLTCPFYIQKGWCQYFGYGTYGY